MSSYPFSLHQPSNNRSSTPPSPPPQNLNFMPQPTAPAFLFSSSSNIGHGFQTEANITGKKEYPVMTTPSAPFHKQPNKQTKAESRLTYPSHQHPNPLSKTNPLKPPIPSSSQNSLDVSATLESTCDVITPSSSLYSGSSCWSPC